MGYVVSACCVGSVMFIRDSDSNYPCPSIYKLELLLKKDLLSTWGLPLDVLKTENDESIATSQQVQQPKK